MCQKVCAIIGHGAQRFRFKYNENYKLCKKIKNVLTAEIKKLYTQGVNTFWVGGSIGVDTWSAEIILTLKKQRDFTDMRLCVALPFPGFKAHYDAKQQTRLRDILQSCDEKVVVSKQESIKAYQVRNEYIVDRADCLLAIYDNAPSFRSDTEMTVYYAKKRKLPIILIHPDTVAVTTL